MGGEGPDDGALGLEKARNRARDFGVVFFFFFFNPSADGEK